MNNYYQSLLDCDKIDGRREKYRIIYNIINTALSDGFQKELNELFDNNTLQNLSLDAIFGVLAFSAVACDELPNRKEFYLNFRKRVIEEKGIEYARHSIDCIY